MIINAHGSLGDEIMLTGLPRAYFKSYNERTYVNTKRPDLWNNNPYLTGSPGGIEFTYSFNQFPKDHMVYTPVRLFYDLTGRIVDRMEVCPIIYTTAKRDRTCVVNDQAGWPSRVGYPYFDELITRVKAMGFKIVYLRNETFRDCNGNLPPRQITGHDEVLYDIPLNHLIAVIASCQLYIGYNSGISQIAGATLTPYIQIEGSVPGINTRHNSCLHIINSGNCRKCAVENCENQCLVHTSDQNDLAINAIKSLRNAYLSA